MEDKSKKLSEQRCICEFEEAGVSAYEEVTKLFSQIDDKNSLEFEKYLGLVKESVGERSAVCQEKGLEAILAFIRNYADAGKTVPEVMSGIVGNFLATPKVKIRELAMQVSLMYVEVGKGDFVVKELLKGTEQKNPIIVIGSVQILTQALKEFGTKVISPKPIITRIGKLLSDRDKDVRNETRAMVIELYKWMGLTLEINLQLVNLKPTVSYLQELLYLNAEFGKFEGEEPTPTRYVRSQPQKQAAMAANNITTKITDNNEEKEDKNEAIQHLVSTIDILFKLPKDFYEKIEAKKWQERKEVLESVVTLVKNQKLKNGYYGHLVRAVKKVLLEIKILKTTRNPPETQSKKGKENDVVDAERGSWNSNIHNKGKERLQSEIRDSIFQ
ncbi:hypothetical protein ABEB36_015705 [Hypothenemus hampei]|uniref:TOG domain-containing protein n=1 Tax=Hypothenemus hampei TaxID=57062 RepID=A0ABD1E3J3_HYPHA